ncbi:MAG: regulatory protein RecX [Candidatus Acidiferrales bacterium]
MKAPLASLPVCLYRSMVFSRTKKKLATESQIYASAVRALMRRAHSVFEMRKYLEERAEDKADVKTVLARLRENRYLDDARYAQEFARHRAKYRRQGRFRIARELRARGVADAHIEAALDAVFAETDEAALVRARIKRKLALIRGPIDQRKAASLYSGLLRAGFSGDVIRAELRAARIEAAAELAEAEANSEEDLA